MFIVIIRKRVILISIVIYSKYKEFENLFIIRLLYRVTNYILLSYSILTLYYNTISYYTLV